MSSRQSSVLISVICTRRREEFKPEELEVLADLRTQARKITNMAISSIDDSEARESTMASKLNEAFDYYSNSLGTDNDRSSLSKFEDTIKKLTKA